MNVDKLLDFLNSYLLPTFNTTSIEFKISDIEDAIYFSIGRNRHYAARPRVWVSNYWQYNEFFDYQDSFFDCCKRLHAYYMYRPSYWQYDLKQRLDISDTDIQFIETMANCRGCRSCEELKVKLDLLGY